MTILIAGSSGIIGSYLTKYLKNNYNIICTADKGIQSNHERFIRADLTKPNDIENLIFNLPKLDAVIFLTGLAHFKGNRLDFSKFNTVNFQTLKNLIKALSASNKLPLFFVFASTISVYGERQKTIEYKENFELRPESPYAKTKASAENFLREQLPTNHWILRFAPVYSNNFNLNIDRRTRLAGHYYQVGDGMKRLSLLNIMNIGVTIKGIIEKKIPSGIYNLSDSKTYTYKDLLNQKEASKILKIPLIAARIVLIIGQLTGNIFLKENALKLLNSNIYPSEKIRRYIQLPYFLGETEID